MTSPRPFHAMKQKQLIPLQRPRMPNVPRSHLLKRYARFVTGLKAIINIIPHDFAVRHLGWRAPCGKRARTAARGHAQDLCVSRFCWYMPQCPLVLLILDCRLTLAADLANCALVCHQWKAVSS